MSVLYDGEVLKASENDYDWLGHGVYFWENNLTRAREWAAKKHRRNAFVIGAVIDFGNCLDLTSGDYSKVLQGHYDVLKDIYPKLGKALPRNVSISKHGDALLRYLDCTVIEGLHAAQVAHPDLAQEYATVRGVFLEGGPLFEGSAFKEQTHAQICVRKREAILGYFLPPIT